MKIILLVSRILLLIVAIFSYFWGNRDKYKSYKKSSYLESIGYIFFIIGTLAGIASVMLDVTRHCELIFTLSITIGFLLIYIYLLQEKGVLIKKLSYDSLTKIYTRDKALKILQNMKKHNSKENCNLSIMFLDLDQFKLYNDMFGHLQGDLILYEVAKYLKYHCRKNDIIARYGGDEFIIILPNTSSDEALKIKHRLQNNITNYNWPHDIDLSLSIGISAYPDDSVDIEKLLQLADKRMYLDKQKIN
ncbi:hypothetical protein SYNTR_1214 [Candidatus Syntrophocurvum alkaliphilum]|uniref:GGDEF domain-containing protein n=1 Tax=Candidatus Syntrophocurvum alkaliphilum TaxID=2293317 RepID=A0A6I6DFE0_9FIRM|nr:GGDEF domain-containing protein [Candidatus Syntrophocurvum alkaliphilum]QGT99807.1 hypothetical protein SYNTR_1214 [Candidatus Syntrophocurvum alkaliphilum]